MTFRARIVTVAAVGFLASATILGQLAQASGAPTSASDAAGVVGVGPAGGAQANGWLTVSAGYQHTCGIRDDATMWCWGDNSSGQLGDGSYTGHRTPVQVGIRSWASVSTSSGGMDTCGIRADGGLWCWGLNTGGQIRRYGAATYDRPVRAGGPAEWTSVAVGDWHTCGVRVDGTVWCWGWNRYGALGYKTANSYSGPRMVGANTDWAYVVAGYGHTCATRTDGTLWCWGWNLFGQIGQGTTKKSYRHPVQVGSTVDWATITAGGRQTCATRIDGTAWCWGLNTDGELGDGSTIDRSVPVQVGSGIWASVTEGENHTCGTHTDGTAWCWGSNAFGGDGDGTRTDRLTPVQVGIGKTWQVISAGGNHTVATASDGTAWSWGLNTSGQLGDGTHKTRLAPVEVDDR
jgi:alpha-tubulin suppressor-like RCC1 family protein